jgi:FkbH-like protein
MIFAGFTGFAGTDGTPRYYDCKTRPLDIQCPAQGIQTLINLRRLHPQSVETAEKVARRTLAHMLDGKVFSTIGITRSLRTRRLRCTGDRRRCSRRSQCWINTTTLSHQPSPLRRAEGTAFSGKRFSLSQAFMSRQPYRIGLLSDFNAQNLAVLMQKNWPAPGAKSVVAPFGQTTPTLLNSQADFWAEPFDAVVIWTLPQVCIPGFQKVLACEEFSMEELLMEVDAFAALVQRTPENVWTVIVASFATPGVGRGLGMLDLRDQVGAANALMQMNLRLVRQLGPDKRVVLLDAQRWLSAVGPDAYNAKLWYMSKTPFQNSVFREAAGDVLAVLDGIQGRNKKVLILDLDNTLWGGIVGDDGWENLRIGGHDPVGEAFADFQMRLKSLVNRGVLLAIVSKNEESTALEAIRRHPEMILKLEDFAGWKINWQDKARNITDLMAELNLGLDSAVFLDDSSFERARVRETLPQVLAPDLPADPMDYPSFLATLRCFDSPAISGEDRKRTTMYVADRQRTALKSESRSLEDWLAQLDLRVVVETLNDANLERAAQLFNKTNQMNLSTRRLNATELMAWSKATGNQIWTFRIADRFGDYGLCGISSFMHEGVRGRMLDFLLSCRVMGRGVEEAMLCIVAQHARNAGCAELCAEYIPSPKNQPCERWLQSQARMQRENGSFRLPLADAPAMPVHVKISGN